jgi:hypothetical protein
VLDCSPELPSGDEVLSDRDEPRVQFLNERALSQPRTSEHGCAPTPRNLRTNRSAPMRQHFVSSASIRIGHAQQPKQRKAPAQNRFAEQGLSACTVLDVADLRSVARRGGVDESIEKLMRTKTEAQAKRLDWRRWIDATQRRQRYQLLEVVDPGAPSRRHRRTPNRPGRRCAPTKWRPDPGMPMSPRKRKLAALQHRGGPSASPPTPTGGTCGGARVLTAATANVPPGPHDSGAEGDHHEVKIITDSAHQQYLVGTVLLEPYRKYQRHTRSVVAALPCRLGFHASCQLHAHGD